MNTLNTQIDQIATHRFLTALRGIGKTTGIVENIKSYIDDTLLYKNDFEVLVIVENQEMKRMMKTRLTDYYFKYTDVVTMQEVMYKLSEFPIMDGKEGDVPNICRFQFGTPENPKKYEKFFVDPSCYEVLCLRQLDKLKQIGDLLYE